MNSNLLVLHALSGNDPADGILDMINDSGGRVDVMVFVALGPEYARPD